MILLGLIVLTVPYYESIVTRKYGENYSLIVTIKKHKFVIIMVDLYEMLGGGFFVINSVCLATVYPRVFTIIEGQYNLSLIILSCNVLKFVSYEN